jgi:hypothetical protein
VLGKEQNDLRTFVYKLMICVVRNEEKFYFFRFRSEQTRFLKNGDKISGFSTDSRV